MKIFYTKQYEKNGIGKQKSGAFLKQVLCECCGFPDSIEIKTHEQGRRFIEKCYGIHFSITHTGNFWFCAVSEHPCGIDAELLTRTFSRPEKLAARFLTEEEQRYVCSGESTEAEGEKLLYLWTRKEAYLKYTGEGLYGLHDSPSVVDAPAGTQIHTWYGEHVCLSICTEDVQQIDRLELIDLEKEKEA